MAGIKCDTSRQQSDIAASRIFLNASAEAVIKVGGATAASLYFFGLVSMNAYLLQFGVTQFLPFNARFVLTGWVVLIPVLIIVLIVWMIQNRYARIFLKSTDKVGEISKSKMVVSRVISILACFVFLGSLVLSFYLYHYSTGGWAGGVILSLGFAVPTLVVWDAWMDLKLKRGMPDDDETDIMDGWERALWEKIAVGGAGMFLGAFVYIMVGTPLILPKVPQQLGGAKPENIQIILSKQEVVQWIEYNPSTMGENIVDAQLIWESPNYLAVKAGPYCQVYRIANDVVDGWSSSPESSATPTTRLVGVDMLQSITSDCAWSTQYNR